MSDKYFRSCCQSSDVLPKHTTRSAFGLRKNLGMFALRSFALNHPSTGMASTNPAQQSWPNSPSIQVFKLRGQNRRRDPLPLNAALVRERSPRLQNPVNVKKRPQASVTTTITTTTTKTTTNHGTTQPPPTITETVIIVPSVVFTFVTSGATHVTFTLPNESGVSFPQRSPSSMEPGSGAGGTSVTTTQTPSNGPGGTSPTFSGTTSATTTSVPFVRSTSATQRHVSTIVGSVIGGIVALIIIFALCYRRRSRNRATGPILLADPYHDEDFVNPAEQQQRHAISLAAAQPLGGPAAATGASHSQELSRSPASGGRNLKQGYSYGRDPSISTTHSPPSTSAQDSHAATMADLNILRARILEVENLALRQRIADVENMAHGPSNAIPRASESPPEYASPMVEAPGNAYAY